MISYIFLAILFAVAMVGSHFLGFIWGKKLGLAMTVEVTAEMLGTSPRDLALRLKAFSAKRIAEEESKSNA